MSAALLAVLGFIEANMQLFTALMDVIESGADKASLLATIRAAEIKASDVAMKAELTK